MIEYESLNFTGPQATHTLLDPEGRMYRQSYLVQAAITSAVPGEGVAMTKSETRRYVVRQQVDRMR